MESHTLSRGRAKCSRVTVGEIEKFVVERIHEIGKDPHLVAETIKAARRELEVRRPVIEKDLRCLEKEHERHGRERKNLVNAVGKGKASEAILRRLGELDLAVQDGDAQVAKLTDELAAIEARTIDEADLRTALASFTPIWDPVVPARESQGPAVTHRAGHLRRREGGGGHHVQARRR